MSFTDKKSQYIIAIKSEDRERIERIAIQHRLRGTTLTEHRYCRFIKLAAQLNDVSLASLIHEVRPKLDAATAAQLLWTLIEDGDTTIASMLVKAGADVNQPHVNDPLGLSFLHVLAKSNHPNKNELALLMMNHGAITTAQDLDGYTVLEYAITNGNISLGRELLVRDASTDEHTLYAAACCSKPVESMLLLVNVKRAKNPEIQSQLVADAFKALCEFDIDDVKIEGMIQALLDVEVPASGVIIEAILYGKTKVVKLLLERNDIDNRTKMIFLHGAASLPESSMAQMLIERGADIESSMHFDVEHFNRGMRPLHVACQYGSQENIQLLLNLGANVNYTDVYGNTPFSFLIHDQLNEPCRLMIKHFALLTSKGDMVNQQDLEYIASDAILQQFYGECLHELNKMNEIRFFNGISYHSIITNNLKYLSMLMRRQKFLENCKVNLNSFSLYQDDLNSRLREAHSRKDLLEPKVGALCEALNGILPHVPIQLIIKHLYFDDIESLKK